MYDDLYTLTLMLLTGVELGSMYCLHVLPKR